jgi:nucleoside-diphosphate-sugar epimerase
MSNILVTGATGFIGSHLVENIVKKHNLRCLVRTNSDTTFLKKLGVEINFGDLTKKETLHGVTKDIDVVFHIAAQMRKWNLPANVYWNINVTGTKNILEESLKENVNQFIHCSTVSIIGPFKGKPLNENYTSYNTSNIYNKTKAEAEKFVLSYRSLMPITIIYPDLIFGPRNFNYLPLFRAIKHKKIQFIGNGDNFHQPTFVSDVVQGFMLVFKNKKAIGEKFIIVSEKPITTKEMIYTISDEFDVKISPLHIPLNLAKMGRFVLEGLGQMLNFEPPLTQAIIDFFTINHAYEISKAKKILGYKPKITFKEGVKKTIEWYTENKLL